MCVGFCEVLVFPSPNTQFHDVGVLEDVSVNVTDNGDTPVVALSVNEAIGAESGPTVLTTGAFSAV